jgi:hypothetical protein
VETFWCVLVDSQRRYSINVLQRVVRLGSHSAAERPKADKMIGAKNGNV